MPATPTRLWSGPYNDHGAQIVMQDPDIRHGASLQPEDDFHQTITDGRAEKRHMLMMMIPRRDTDFRRDR